MNLHKSYPLRELLWEVFLRTEEGEKHPEDEVLAEWIEKGGGWEHLSHCNTCRKIWLMGREQGEEKRDFLTTSLSFLLPPLAVAASLVLTLIGFSLWQKMQLARLEKENAHLTAVVQRLESWESDTVYVIPVVLRTGTENGEQKKVGKKLEAQILWLDPQALESLERGQPVQSYLEFIPSRKLIRVLQPGEKKEEKY